MRPLIHVYYPLLCAVAAVRHKKCQQQILNQLKKNKRIVGCMKEIAKNLIKGDLKLSKTDKRKLNRHSNLIRSLAKGKSIEQSGGFLNLALPILASVISGLLVK